MELLEGFRLGRQNSVDTTYFITNLPRSFEDIIDVFVGHKQIYTFSSRKGSDFL